MVRRGVYAEQAYKRLRAEGFSDGEADWYAERDIYSRSMVRLRKARKRFVKRLTKRQLDLFWIAMDDYISDVVRPGKLPEEIEVLVTSPGQDDIPDVVELWEAQLGGALRISHK